MEADTLDQRAGDAGQEWTREQISWKVATSDHASIVDWINASLTELAAAQEWQVKFCGYDDKGALDAYVAEQMQPLVEALTLARVHVASIWLGDKIDAALAKVGK